MKKNKDIDLDKLEEIKYTINQQLEIFEAARDFKKKVDEICKLLCFLSEDNNNIDQQDVFKVMLAYNDLHTKVKDIIDKYNINELYDKKVNGDNNL